MTSKTVVTLHYRSPEDDPFKVPRPTRIALNDHDSVVTTGGEGSIVGDQLIGLSRQEGPPEDFTPDNWVEAEDLALLHSGAPIRDLSGWYPTFMSTDGIYTWSGQVDHVEITTTVDGAVVL